jgi:methyl-accepting chemotaxis protein
VSNGSQDQARRVQELLQAIESPAAVAQQAAATSQETAAITQQLEELTEKRKAVVRVFKFRDERRAA